MKRNRTASLLAPIAASALIFSLAACGSDDDGSSDAVAETSESTMADPSSGTTDDMSDDMSGEMSDDMSGQMDDLAGGEAIVGDIAVSDVWVRQPAEGQTASAAYGTITNNGDADITLVAGSVPFGATVEIHETLMDDAGTMQMEEREAGFVIAAGETFMLEPGGPHIMLLDIDPADVVGEIDVTMIFDDGTEVTVAAPVRSIGGMDMDMGDMSGTTDG